MRASLGGYIGVVVPVKSHMDTWRREGAPREAPEGRPMALLGKRGAIPPCLVYSNLERRATRMVTSAVRSTTP